MGTLKVDNLQKRDGTSLITSGVATSNLLSASALRTAGVGQIKLNTTDITSSTATANFNSTYITDTYDIFQLRYSGLDPVTDGVSLRGRLSTDNGSSFITTTYKTGYYYNKISGSGSSQSGSSQSNYFSDTLTVGNDSGFQHSGIITFYGLRSTTHHKVLIQEHVINGTNGVPYHVAQNWYIENTSAINYIEMSFSSGNISKGIFSLYGMVK
tara:strand:+ start:1011 stop:1646 length:636 start_codon:yes stop_codon:yes gene_type:complete